MRRPVVSGAGAVCAFGAGLPALFDGLAAGRAAVGPIHCFDASALPVRVAGEVPVESADASWVCQRLGDSDQVRDWGRRGYFRDRKVAFALVAAAEAWASAHCGPAERGAALSVALGMEHTLFEDLALLFDGEEINWAREPAAGLPEVRLRVPFDLAARAVVDHLGLGGELAVHASACAGGALAVAWAAAQIARGETPVALCGASDSMLEPFGLGGIARLGAPSPRNEPDACRPFDRRRDGMAVGEGAAMFVLEDEERALARGVKPWARVLGWGSSQDAWRLTAPRPDGSAAARAMCQALRRAGLEAPGIGYVNAHGTGTLLNDVAEARALHLALGRAAQRVPVSSIKGAVGHLMAASGAIELAACLLPFDRGILPGTAHHREPDPECDLRVIGEEPVRAEVEAVLSNSFGFGGQNAAVILGRWP